MQYETALLLQRISEVFVLILASSVLTLLTIFTIRMFRDAVRGKKRVERKGNYILEEVEKQKNNKSQKSKDDGYKTAKTKNEKENTIEDLIRNHHEQAIQQASVQFWFSLVASVVGFIFILIMILISKDSKWYEYILKLLPGAIVEAVSLLFFQQSKEIRDRSSDFLNRLRNDDQITKSVKIADSIENTELKSLVKTKIALHICGIDETQNFHGERNQNKHLENNTAD